MFLKESNSPDEKSIYIMQRISIDNKPYNIFFDTGCDDLACRHDAIKRLGPRATQELKGPIMVGELAVSLLRQSMVYSKSEFQCLMVEKLTSQVSHLIKLQQHFLSIPYKAMLNKTYTELTSTKAEILTACQPYPKA